MLVPLPNLGGKTLRSKGNINHSIKSSDLDASPLHAIVSNGDKSVFVTDAIRALIEYKWQAYGKKIFIRQLLVYVAFCIIFSAFAILFAREKEVDSLRTVYLETGAGGNEIYVLFSHSLKELQESYFNY